jgi:hypothetical protein
VAEELAIDGVGRFYWIGGEGAERVNSQGVLLETADDYFLQNAGVNTINNVKSSSRPNNMAKLQTQI